MSDPKQYDDVIGMLTDQCHQYALEIERLKAAPHNDDTCPHLVVLGRLEAENARLKAEVERLTMLQVETLAERNNAEAEVERLKAEPDALTAYLYADTLRRDDIKTLKAQIERLTKAGDMCDQLLACFEMEGRRGVNIGRDMWLAAKEGNPHA